jgi:signal peptidase I
MRESSMQTKSKDLGPQTSSALPTPRSLPVLPSAEAKNPQAARETVESIVVAVILAFLFRAFIAEAFVIPTGSMAPTLQGRHMDVRCSQCGYQYRTGASGENPDSLQKHQVEQTTCPMCHFTMQLQKKSDANQRSFNGDRILVSKFSYVLGDPKRWDVIVFKYPGNAKQNYIKRLVGLPGESITIRHGDIFTQPVGNSDNPETRKIERKPPDKVKAMLQLVHDTNYVSRDLQAVNWPSRWQSADGWKAVKESQSWSMSPTTGDAWLRYRHLIPWSEDWPTIINGERPDRLDHYQGQLITDYYEYNDNDTPYADPIGQHWVGDLAVECDVDVKRAEGEMLLDLVEGGTHFYCRIDLATGIATLSIQGKPDAFSDGQGNSTSSPTGQTPIHQPGSYKLRFANVDDQILLWVGGRLISFQGPTTYDAPRDVVPRWSESDPADLAPVGVGARKAELQVNRLQVLRDVYYVAVSPTQVNEYSVVMSPYSIQQILANPKDWGRTSLFKSRRSVKFDLQKDQFFPMGDNSPQSKDARLWAGGNPLIGFRDPPPYVARELLIGKALLIYWPHAWRGPFDIPLIPNFARMGLIH